MEGFSEKDFNETSAEKIHRNKPKPVNNQPTEYLAQVIDAEEKNGFKGYSILIHYRIVEAPNHQDASSVGMQFAFVSQPTQVEQSKKKLEIAKVKRAFGAALGLDDRQAGALTLTAIQKSFRTPERPSALRGTIVKISAHPVTTKAGKAAGKVNDSAAWDPYPYLVEGQPVVRPIDSSVQSDEPKEETPAAAAPPPPPPPAAAPAAPDHFARALAEGWAPHPSSPGAFFKGTASKWEADLKAGNF